MPIVGNRSMLDRTESQLIVRATLDDQDHYVCLHGEPDRVSIERGEGHEQPDQLQLLYYVGNQSVIMDAGYDRGFITSNSSWNRYTDHNVMAYPKGDSGMNTPIPISKQVSHPPVDFLFIEPNTPGRLFILKGQTRLQWRNLPRLLDDGFEQETDGRYERHVLFVADPEHPYLIDINQIDNHTMNGNAPPVQMRYHVDSDNFVKRNSDNWFTWLHETQNNVYLYFSSVEQEANDDRVVIEQADVEEQFRNKRQIKRFTFTSEPASSLTTLGLFKASAYKPALEPQVLAQSPNFKIWQWVNVEAGTVDVILVRSLALPKNQWQPVHFDVNMADDSVQLCCAPSQQVGFARFKKGDLLQDYSFGLELYSNEQPA